MNTKHTPGPWMQRRDSLGNVRILGNVIGGPVAYVEEMNNTGGTPQDHANARLIAAAPELLEALMACERELSAVWSGQGQINDNRHALNARAAIAKATNP